MSHALMTGFLWLMFFDHAEACATGLGLFIRMSNLDIVARIPLQTRVWLRLKEKRLIQDENAQSKENSGVGCNI